MAAAVVAMAKKDKDAAAGVFEAIALNPVVSWSHQNILWSWYFGSHGSEVLSWLQAKTIRKASRLVCIVSNYYIGKAWLWWPLWLDVKCTKFAQSKAEYL